ncbi:MAG: hypothetical protein JXR13_04160 [Thalassovita sp.]
MKKRSLDKYTPDDISAIERRKSRVQRGTGPDAATGSFQQWLAQPNWGIINWDDGYTSTVPLEELYVDG